MSLVRKILRCLPKNWEAKVTTIIEAKDLSTLGLDELMGSLMTHEITMKDMRILKTKRKVELHSKHHQIKEMKTPVRMKAMTCLVEISKSTSRKTIIEKEDLSKRNTTKITRKNLLFTMSAKILDI